MTENFDYILDAFVVGMRHSGETWKFTEKQKMLVMYGKVIHVHCCRLILFGIFLGVLSVKDIVKLLSVDNYNESVMFAF